MAVNASCASHAEGDSGLAWRTMDVAPDIADVLDTSSGAQALGDAQVGWHRSWSHGVHLYKKVSK